MNKNMVNVTSRDISLEFYNWLYDEYDSAFNDHFHYSYALELLEKVLLASDITVEGSRPSVSLDMLLDYSTCLAKTAQFDKAVSNVRACQEYMTDNENKLSLETKVSIWGKICRIYAFCLDGESLSEALVEMEKQGIKPSIKFLKNLALKCSFGNNFDLALWLYDMALQSANSIGDFDEANKIEEKITKIKQKNNDKLVGNYTGLINYEQFLASGEELVPGMYIGCFTENINRTINPNATPDLPKNMPFLIYKVEGDWVYVIRLKEYVEKRDRDRFHFAIQSGRKKIFKEHLYKLPVGVMACGVIEGVEGRIEIEVLEQALEDLYQKLVHSYKRGVPEFEPYAIDFIQEMTDKRTGTVGERLVIGGEYYYIVKVDTESGEYVVVPVENSSYVKGNHAYIIPFKHEGIFGIVTSSEAQKRVANSGVGKCELDNPYRFIEYDGKPYLIVGEDDDNYICRNIVDESLGEKSCVCYLPKSLVDLSKCCKKEDIFKYFNNINPKRSYARRHVGN